MSINNDTQFEIPLKGDDDKSNGIQLVPRISGISSNDSRETEEPSYSVKCNLVQVCHGTMDDSGSPASLIVILLSFQPPGHRKKFNRVKITLHFHGSSGSASDLAISDIAPKFNSRIYPSEATVNAGDEIDVVVEADVGIRNETPVYKWGNTTQANTTQSIISINPEASVIKNESWVQWDIKFEGEELKSGTTTIIQTAVLVERKHSHKCSTIGEEFSMEIGIQGEVISTNTLGGKDKNDVKRLSGCEKRDACVLFNTKNVKRGKIKDANNLKGEDLGAYWKLLTTQSQSGDSDAKGKSKEIEKVGPNTVTPPTYFEPETKQETIITKTEFNGSETRQYRQETIQSKATKIVKPSVLATEAQPQTPEVTAPTASTTGSSPITQIIPDNEIPTLCNELEALEDPGPGPGLILARNQLKTVKIELNLLRRLVKSKEEAQRQILNEIILYKKTIPS